MLFQPGLPPCFHDDVAGNVLWQSPNDANDILLPKWSFLCCLSEQLALLLTTGGHPCN